MLDSLFLRSIEIFHLIFIKPGNKEADGENNISSVYVPDDDFVNTFVNY